MHGGRQLAVQRRTIQATERGQRLEPRRNLGWTVGVDGARASFVSGVERGQEVDDLATAPISTPASGISYGSTGDDVLSALVNLGYARPVAQKAVDAALERDPNAKANFEALFRAAMASIR